MNLIVKCKHTSGMPANSLFFYKRNCYLNMQIKMFIGNYFSFLIYEALRTLLCTSKYLIWVWIFIDPVFLKTNTTTWIAYLEAETSLCQQTSV